MNRLWRGAFKSALRAEGVWRKKDKILSSVAKEVIQNKDRRILCCKHWAKMLRFSCRSDPLWNTERPFVELVLNAGVMIESWDELWLFPPRVMDMWGCVKWGRYFPQDNGVREALQLQPPYTHTLSSWCLGFGLVISPSHCDILVSLPMASCHSPANKCPWFPPMPSFTSTQIFNPLRIPVLEAVLPILKLHVPSGMRSLISISKFPNFLLHWGSHSKLFCEEAVQAVEMQFNVFYVGRSKPLMLLLAFWKGPWPSGAESTCISGKQVPLRGLKWIIHKVLYSKSSCACFAPDARQTDVTASFRSSFALSPSFAESSLHTSCQLDVCISSSFPWALFSPDRLYTFWLPQPGWLSSYLTALPKNISLFPLDAPLLVVTDSILTLVSARGFVSSPPTAVTVFAILQSDGFKHL